MNLKEEYLLKNFQELMQPHERMVACWLTEEWDQTTNKLPSWLNNKVWSKFTANTKADPNALARAICLKLLQNHKHEIHLPK